jgi:hypothetical protein
MSSPLSETPSPAADDDDERSQQPSMEQLFAVLQREILEGRGQTPKPSTLLAQESGAEPTDNGAYQEIEKIISELSSSENATGIAPRENMASHEEIFSMQHSEYVVEENWTETEVLSVDGSDDARSIPLDIPEVVETVQEYEVEEPETDGRSTEVGVIRPYAFVSDHTQALEIAIQVVNNEDASITATRTQLTDSSPESVLSPVLEYPAFALDAPLSEGTLQSGPLSTATVIPAPIVADPSVPDPVPGDSSPASPAPVDSSIAPRLSIDPPLKTSDVEPSQISTGISGLFTPAQRSGVGTPVVTEDETAEPTRTPDNEINAGLLAVSIPPADTRSPSDKHLPAAEEDGGNAAGDEDLVNPIVKVPGPSSENAHPLAAAVVDVDVQEPNLHSVDTDDDISSTPRGGSIEPAASPLLTGDTSGASLKHSDLPDASGERPHQGFDIAEGDEDADGEADPDYPQEVATAADVAVESKPVSNGVGNDTPTREEVVLHTENPPVR